MHLQWSVRSDIKIGLKWFNRYIEHVKDLARTQTTLAARREDRYTVPSRSNTQRLMLYVTDKAPTQILDTQERAHIAMFRPLANATLAGFAQPAGLPLRALAPMVA